MANKEVICEKWKTKSWKYNLKKNVSRSLFITSSNLVVRRSAVRKWFLDVQIIISKKCRAMYSSVKFYGHVNLCYQRPHSSLISFWRQRVWYHHKYWNKIKHILLYVISCIMSRRTMLSRVTACRHIASRHFMSRHVIIFRII